MVPVTLVFQRGKGVIPLYNLYFPTLAKQTIGVGWGCGLRNYSSGNMPHLTKGLVIKYGGGGL